MCPSLISIAVIKNVTQRHLQKKGLFVLYFFSTVYHWRKILTNLEIGTEVETTKEQRVLFTGLFLWLAHLGLLSVCNSGPPDQRQHHTQWARLYSISITNQKKNVPKWWRHFLNCTSFFLYEPGLCHVDKIWHWNYWVSLKCLPYLWTEKNASLVLGSKRTSYIISLSRAR